MKMPILAVKSGLLLASVWFGTLAAGASEMGAVTAAATSGAGGVYTYDLTLTNTGTTPIGTLWFSWVPGAGFLTAVPGSYASPTGWTEKATNAGAAIQWTTTVDALAAGSSLSGFEFTSIETPTQLAALDTSGSFTEPGSVFFLYQGAPLAAGDPGYLGVAAVTSTPEPASFVLMGTGLLGAAGVLRRRIRRDALTRGV